VTIADVVGLVLMGLGVVFFLGGSVGMLRLPDTHARLHALTKADNVGLGLVILGLAVRAGSVPFGLKLLVIWLLALLSSTAVAYAVASRTAPDRASLEADDDG
jgi:multicomponent Na+:H+ antiporter subunit G